MSLPMGLFSILYRTLCIDTLLNVVPAALRFCFAWLFSRRYWRLIPGLIPLAAGFVVLTAVFASRIPGHNQQLLQTYLTQARDSAQNGNLTSARLNFRRALQLSAGSHDVRFEFAVALFDMDQREEAYRMLAGMAPLRKTGYLPAHRFLARQFESEKPGITAVVRTLHLSHVVRQSRDNREDRQRLLAQLIQLRQLDAAEKLLRETLDDFPEDRLLLVELKSATGDQRAAAIEAEAAVRQLQPLLRQSPNDIDRRLQLAQGLQYAGKFAQAIMVLEQGLQTASDNRLIAAIAAKCSHWLSLQPPASRRLQFECLQKLAQMETPEPTADITLNQFFVHIFQSDRRDVLLQFLMGTINASQGQLDAAETNLRNALRLSDGNPVVQNNLACVLLEQARITQVTAASARAIASTNTMMELSADVDAPGHSPIVASTTGPAAQPAATQRETAGALDSLAAESVAAVSPDAVSPAAVSPAAVSPEADKYLREALQLIDLAISQSDHIGEFYDTRAQILAMSARHAEATQQWQLCLAHGLNDARIHRQLARNLNLLGRTEEAVRHSQLAEQLGVDSRP